MPKTDPDLTPATTSAGLAVPTLSLTNPDDEWGDVDVIDLAPAGGLRIPHAKVNRKLDGGVVDPTTGELTRLFYLVLLGRGQTRAQWDKAYSGATAGAPDCRSFDALVPDPQSPGLKADACATCEYNRWGDVGDFARCRLSEQWLAFVLDGDGGQYTRIRWGGLAAGPAAAYWSSFALRKPPIRPFEVITEVTLEPTETDNGTFLVPVFRRASDRLTRADVGPLVADLPRLKAAFAGAMADSVVTGEDDEGHGTTPLEPFPDDDRPAGSTTTVDPTTGEVRYDAGEPF